ncbi:GTPase [Micromonospora sp. NPDC051196]|uniref:GTPase family protein n=1 Tax=Micromonospora sp. NPDC051196 TaxID=3155281 RepID=UPI003428CF82
MSNESQQAFECANSEQLRTIADAIRQELDDRWPTIGLIGVSGVGKSSTINSLFKTDLPTSSTTACTKEFRDTDLKVEFTSPSAKQGFEPLAGGPADVRLRVVDAPGLGEDVRRDKQYLDLYREHLPRCDVVLWVSSARNRAVSLDQMYLEQLPEIHDRLVFGVNQIDLIEPLDWRSGYGIPSLEQERRMKEILADRSERFAHIIGREPTMIGYSSKHGYHLERLFAAIIDSCPPERKWIFLGLKNFSHEDFVPEGMKRNLLFRLITWALSPRSKDSAPVGGGTNALAPSLSTNPASDERATHGSAGLSENDPKMDRGEQHRRDS